MRLTRPLVALLSEAADADGRAAFGRGEKDLSRAALRHDALALAAALAGDRGGRWLVETEDPYRVAVALLAATLAGTRVALPPNLQAGTLRELAADCARVFVDVGAHEGETSPANDAAGASLRMDPLAPGRSGAALPASDVRVDRDAVLVELFTSGTSGPGKLVPKALRHLEDEVVELEALFGAAVPADASFVATVPAHHLYGLLFRVLWPLSSKRALDRDRVLLPDELLARVAAAAPAVVLSSPAHLRHLAASPRLVEHRGRIAAVFSSGGPLETATALALEAALGSAPIEIFGSTETGGVAFRRAGAADPSPRWIPFPSVSLELEDGCLAVASPFVSATEASGGDVGPRWRMGDRAERDGEGFRLLGRSDRIAKIGEKSLSLPEIEAALAAHELVEAAAAATWTGRSGPRLSAVVVLSTAGKRRLAEEGRRAVVGLLGDHLAERWAPVALPRRWRFVDALPVDARGKLAQKALEQELATPVADTLLPLLLSEAREGDDVVRELVVPRDLAYLEGHYDAFPLVPGAVQIHWVMLAIGSVLGCPVRGERMEAVKFKSVMRPAQRFTMRLRSEAGGARWSFTLAHGDLVFSSGRITTAA
jgi:acyl-coenzyme A synthetase/AMP-(fatty) acid ligase/3-hydroxymyristoyl/3-hydroxydecanoyl-(acyl carrier protein) dehydratase